MQQHPRPSATDSPSVDGQQHKQCTICGQRYDAHDFAQYAHHTNAPHVPLEDVNQRTE
ncbi:MAG: hypothetical protein M0D54_18085 [Hyphomonadaceae bacterium JAD_PAG50586_4]|nr:MAG: hypothetical protein M0D54_18085 [Hyphomonadaceae bacterium JAD_PAG50586_4]